MPFEQFARAWSMDSMQRELAPTTKLLLMTLTDHADWDGCTSIKVYELAEKLNVNALTIRTHIKLLEDEGLIMTYRKARNHIAQIQVLL